MTDVREVLLDRFNNGQFNDLDYEVLKRATSAANLPDGNNFDIEQMDNWTDDMVSEYAQYLHNYLYSYKPEATAVDPSIDPNEAHRGPMAQDIEQVAPDCVKETASGVKVVDGDRLALVNAGVIGEISRRLIRLEKLLGVHEDV